MAKYYPRHKYGAKRQEVDGIVFPSTRQAARYLELKLLQSAGEISELSLEPRFELVVKSVLIGRYTPDFQYKEKGNRKLVVEEVKGYASRDYVLRKKLFQALFPQFQFREVR